MKRLSKILIVSFAISMVLFCLSACNGEGHTHAHVAMTANPTCTEKGLITYTCSCGDVYTVEIPALTHEIKVHQAQEPTCAEIGWEEYETCEREGCGYSTYKEISATGEHTWNEGEITTEPTCTEKGIKTFTCTSCNTATRTEPIEIIDHEFSEDWMYDENNHFLKCSCGEIKDNATHVPVQDKIGNTVCKVCDYIINEISGLAFNTLTVNGTNVYGKVSNATEVFSFINEVETFGKTKYIVSLDIYGVHTVVTKTIPLKAGDNVVYLIEMLDDEPIEIYTVTVRRRPMHNVTFNENGGTAVSNQLVEEDHFATAPETSRAGYQFVEWDYNFESPIVSDTTINAIWEANTDTKYTVNYYWQNVEDDNYTLHETLNLTGTTDTIATAEIKVYEHFTPVKQTVSGNIAGDGSLVLEVYYTRDFYRIATNGNNAKAGRYTIVNNSFRYENEITLTTTTNAGYTFTGWYEGETLVCEAPEFAFSVNRNVTYTAKWFTHTDTKYTVNYYLQSVAGVDFVLYETENLTGTTDTTATAEIKVYEHFTPVKQTVSGNIAGDGSLVLEVYYTRDFYRIATNGNNAKAGRYTIVNNSFRYENEITLTATTNAGYSFIGWYDGETLVCETPEFAFSVNRNVTYTAKWQANTDTKYTVNYYLQDLDVKNYTLKETVNLTGTTDTIATAEIKKYEHFTYNADKSMKIGNIEGDGSLVLSICYYRDWYRIATENDNEKAGEITKIAFDYFYETEFILTAKANAGYTFTGWYEGETLVCEAPEFAFSVNRNVTYTAKWQANTDTKYTVNYYWQNVEDDNYTLHETLNLTGTTDTIATAEIKVYEHFTPVKQTVSGNISGDGSLVLDVYYTRNTYTLSLGNTYGSITSEGTYRYGKQIVSTATPYLDCEFLGWYCSDVLLSSETTYAFKIDCNVTAKFQVKEEMANFTFTSTQTTCIITGIKEKTVTSIVVPNYVTSIGSSAFSGCRSLTSVVIPDSVTSIGEEAFSGCFRLVEVINKSSHITLEKGSSNNGYVAYYALAVYNSGDAFTGTKLSNDNGYIIYTDGQEKILVGYLGVETDLTLPSYITKINQYAFYNCSSLTSITIGDSVTSIGSSAFSGCSSLTSVVIPDGVTSIGDSAFYNCSSLIYKIEENLKYLGNENNPYLYLIDTTSTNITSTNINGKCKFIGSSAFYNCYNLTSIVIPDSVTSIGFSAFNGCSSLQSITIPFVGEKMGVTAYETYQYPFGYIFGTNSYENSTATKQLYYGFSTSSKTSSTYYIPSSLKSVTVTGGNILYGAFFYCSSLTSISIPDSVTSIGEDAFYNCYNLTSIVIPDSVTSIGNYAFFGCISLTSIVIPDSATSIGVSAFEDCSGLTSVVIPDSVTSIGSYAFGSCDSLTSVTIGNGVTSIGWYAFYNCSSLTNIIFEDTSTWYTTTNYSNWQNKTGGTWKSVTNSSTNATYFKSTYHDYFWYKL